MNLKVLKCTRDEAIVQVNKKVLKCLHIARSSRRVYVFKDFVLKVDHWDSQNERELRVSGDIDQRDQKYFAKVLGRIFYRGKDILIQERIDLSKHIDSKYKHRRILNRLCEKYNIGDIEESDLRYGRNAVVTAKDELKIYDYGY